MTDQKAEIFAGPKLAIILGSALLLGFAAVIAVGAHDKARLSELEQITEPTSVGDHAFFPVPEKIDPEKVLLTFHGKALRGVELITQRPGKMLKAGMDDSNSFTIYRLNSTEEESARFLFLKTSEDAYLKVRSAEN